MAANIQGSRTDLAKRLSPNCRSKHRGQGPLMSSKARTPPRAGPGPSGGLVYSRQLASSDRSSQSKSPSQRHNLRAQCPFSQANSLGSQGGGVSVWTRPGVHNGRSSADRTPVPTLPTTQCSLTTAQFVAAVLAVFLPITEVVSGDAVPTVARGLSGPTGCGSRNTG